MLRTKLIASALTVCGLALATGCHDDDCEVRNTRVYYEQPCPPPPVVYQSAPVIYQSPPVVYRPRPSFVCAIDMSMFASIAPTTGIGT